MMFVRKILAVLLLLFPVIMMLGFLLHFRSFESFFNFKLSHGTYDAGRLFDALVEGRGHIFTVAHFIVFLSIPLFMLAILILSWFLFPEKPLLAFTGAAIGLIGCTFMAGTIAVWLSFTGIYGVDPHYYEGAKAGFVQLVKMKGVLKTMTQGSYGCFIGMIILAAGLIKQFRLWNMLAIITGSAMFMIFMDLDNWMFIAAVLLLLGFIPLSKKLNNL
jgi:hypothetical protein